MNTNKNYSRLTAYQRTISIILAPKNAFKNINFYPTWVMPFILTSISSIVVNLIAINNKIALKRSLVSSIPNNMRNVTDYLITITLPLNILYTWFIITIIVYFAGKRYLNNDIKFNKIFSMIAWSNVVYIINDVLMIILIIFKKSLDYLITSPAVFFEKQNTTLLYLIMSEIKLFWIWQGILLIIGISIIYKIKIMRSIKFIVTLWLLYIIIKILLKII